MARSSGSIPRETLVTLVSALLDAERRIALLERRLHDARWLGPGEEPNDRDKEVARKRVAASIGALLQAEMNSDDADPDRWGPGSRG
ncbi:MAG: hypothetical protein MUF64_04385 [Polyangiaceae bacterium]|jgi:hypothetical protein|nr:hypothetical protein [Polyangiaceae bacterium]